MCVPLGKRPSGRGKILENPSEAACFIHVVSRY
jgi:hypothetical protein